VDLPVPPSLEQMRTPVASREERIQLHSSILVVIGPSGRGHSGFVIGGFWGRGIFRIHQEAYDAYAEIKEDQYNRERNRG